MGELRTCDPEYLARDHVALGLCSLTLEGRCRWAWGAVAAFSRHVASPRTHNGDC